MTWLIVGGALLVYIAGSYYLMYRDLSKGAGPAGLGWMAFPFAPLMGPLMVGMYLVALPRKLWNAFKP